MHYGIVLLPAEKGIFWVANADWTLRYKCKAYDRGNYCKYIIRAAKKLGLTEGEFSHNFHLSYLPIEEAIAKAKFDHNVTLALRQEGHPDYTDDEWTVAMDNKITELRSKYPGHP